MRHDGTRPGSPYLTISSLWPKGNFLPAGQLWDAGAVRRTVLMPPATFLPMRGGIRWSWPGALLVAGGSGWAGYLVWQFLTNACPTGVPCPILLPPYLNPLLYLGLMVGVLGLWISLDPHRRDIGGAASVPDS